MNVEQIWRYPVKSLGGESLPLASATALGIDYDRKWCLVDQETLRVLSADREPRLLMAGARVVDDSPLITLPDGTETAEDAVLSQWLGRSVSLRTAREGDRGGVDWSGPSGAWHDRAQARITLASRATSGDWDQRRFRSNLLLSAGGEDELVGREVVIGSARLLIELKLERCVIVTRAQPGLDRDLEVLRTINRDRNRTLGVGATVRQHGEFAAGDRVLIAEL